MISLWAFHSFCIDEWICCGCFWCFCGGCFLTSCDTTPCWQSRHWKRSWSWTCLWHDPLSAEQALELKLELAVLIVLSMISRLRVLSAAQSYPLCGGTGCGQYILYWLWHDGPSDSPGGGIGSGHFLVPDQEFHPYVIKMCHLSVQIDYLGEAHLLDVFLRHFCYLRVFQLHWTHCSDFGMTCVHSFLHWRWLMIGLSLSKILGPISPKCSESCM